jgi:hypothetical protein
MTSWNQNVHVPISSLLPDRGCCKIRNTSKVTRQVELLNLKSSDHDSPRFPGGFPSWQSPFCVVCLE